MTNLFPSGRLTLAAVAVYAAGASVMLWPGTGLGARAQNACGQPPLDLRLFWTAEDAAQLWHACGPAGRDAYRAMATYDLVFALLNAGLLATVTLWSLNHTGRPRRRFLLPVGAYLAADCVENAAVWTLLLRGPDLPSAVASIGGLATTVKWTTYAASALVAAGLVVKRLARP